jgi:tyrosine-specific transport protein
MKTLGAILMVAGTTIGAGMLALPPVTAQAGLMPSLLLLLGCWALMTAAALLLAQVALAHPNCANLVSLARATLGRGGAWCVSGVYLLLLYALMTAYLTGGGPLIASLLGIGDTSAILLFAALFGAIVWAGTRSVDLINRLLMSGLLLAYGLLIALLAPHLQPQQLVHRNWEATGPAFALIFTSFGFAIIVPSLARYLNHQARSLRCAILVGSLLPLIVYLLWELTVLGALPLPQQVAILASGEPTRQLPLALAQQLDSTALPWICGAFVFLALVTSFMGVFLSLCHFIEDGIRQSKTRSALLALLPPLLVALIYPQAFIGALEYGGILVALLLVVFPCLMAWKARRVA